jgi:uncharacterized RmlC-like cupin family protein
MGIPTQEGMDSEGNKAFHADFSADMPATQWGRLRARVHLVRASDLDASHVQTPGMIRLTALTGDRVGAANLWMGQTHVAARSSSPNHHHGASETVIFVARGYPEFVFAEYAGESVVESRVRTAPGDYIFVPPFLPHREENPSDDEEAVIVVASNTRLPTYISVPELYPLDPTKITKQ